MSHFLHVVPSTIFEFQFQPWALPALFAAVVNFGLVILIWKKATRDIASKIYIVNLFTLAIISASEFLKRSSQTAESASFWADTGLIGWTFVSVVFFAFIVIITEQGLLLENIFIPFILFGPAFIFWFLAINTNLILLREYNYYSWGWDWSFGPLFPVFLVWLESFFILSILLLVRFYLKTKQAQKKKQVAFILMSSLVPIVGGSITDGILPLFGIYVVGTAVALTIVLSIIVSYAIIKYKLFIISPVVAFSVAIDSMSESLIVLNRSHNIELVNKPACAMLGYKEEELIGKGIRKIIAPGKVWEDYKKQCFVSTTKSTKATISHESEVLSKSGQRIPVRFSVFSQRSPDGGIIGVVMLAFDISQQKKLVHDLGKATEELQLVRYNLEKQIERLKGA